MNKVQFAYPDSVPKELRRFPLIDEVCAKIVHALEEKNWDVPGIHVQFENKYKYRKVAWISGKDFKLWFYRDLYDPKTGQKYNSGISTIVIPKKELQVFSDTENPLLYLYVGKNWKADKKRFLKGLKGWSRQRGENGTYLKYTGKPFLKVDSDGIREYKPKKGDPKTFLTIDVYRDVSQWLEKNVLNKIVQS